jgi:glycosyltransferase involved in cell wall biosynthesis
LKNVLIVAYYFPPSGGPGVQRVLKYSQYLYEFGWRPVILTVEDGDFPARDESLLKDIPDFVKVYRSKIFEPYNIYRKITGKKPGSAVDVNVIPQKGQKRKFSESMAEFIRSTFFIPDARIGWYRHAVKMGKRILEEENIDMIYSSSPPYTCSVIARKLHKISGKPWVAGFRDPWRGFLSTPERWFIPRMIDTHLERSCFKDCSALEVAWKGIILDFNKKYPDIPLSKCHHLNNGFDSADYPAVSYQLNEKFTVTYTGSMYGKRNPQVFIKAVEELVNENKVDKNKICLRFVGRFGNEVLQMFEHPVLKNSFEIIHYLPHAESIKLLLKSEALLMIVDDFKGNEEIVPGKVFEYMGAKRPIITIAPLGAVTQIISETNSGLSARTNDVIKIKEIFLKYYTGFMNKNLVISHDENEIKKYERKEVTKELAKIFNSLIKK